MAPEKRTGGGASEKDEMVIGIAWFRRDEWPKLLEVSADRDQLENTYDEWLESARRTLLKLRAEGRRMEKVEVGVEQLLEWCRTRHVPVDAAARAGLASARLLQHRTNS